MSPSQPSHLEFAPPPQPGRGRAWVIAGLVHLALFMALALGTAWKTQTQTVQAEAELWSAVPQAVAPKSQEPPPPQAPEPVPPATPPQPEKPVAAPPPAPEPDAEQRDAQIALEKQKRLEKKKEDDQRKVEEKRKAIEKEEKLAKSKAAKEKAAKELKAKEERDKKKAALKAKAEAEQKKRKQEQDQKAAQEKADAAQAEALRKENLQRIQGLAGASGGANATGTALKSSGPSSSYAGRLVGRIKPNITYPGDVAGNPRAEVEVRVNPDGSILSRRIVQSSGNKAWDEAVMRAIDKTEVFPKDTDGRVPSVIVLGFRPLD